MRKIVIFLFATKLSKQPTIFTQIVVLFLPIPFIFNVSRENFVVPFSASMRKTTFDKKNKKISVISPSRKPEKGELKK